jgi:serine/threonine-protein kinase HipA
MASETSNLRQIKKVFNMNHAPRINLSLRDIPLKAQEMVGRMSISGVQPKLSVRLDKKLGEIVPATEKGEYILKPQLQQFLNIPENENCCMDIAEDLGIDVPPQCLLRLSDDTLAYIIKRFDRRGTEKIHQEDFFQILEKKDKYQGSLEQIGKKLGEVSVVPGLDVQLFYERVIFNFLIGNGDAHFKNFSILYHEPGGVRLSPAYDIVCSRLVIPNEQDSALTVNGKKNNLLRQDFDALADLLEIPPRVRYEKFEGAKERIGEVVKNSLMPVEFKAKLVEILVSRYARLSIEF